MSSAPTPYEFMQRRIKGVCVDCGTIKPPVDPHTGFENLRCDRCERDRRSEQQKGKNKK